MQAFAGLMKSLSYMLVPSSDGKVLCITMDDFARGHIAPDTIKIDVEGAESSALRGRLNCSPAFGRTSSVR